MSDIGWVSLKKWDFRLSLLRSSVLVSLLPRNPDFAREHGNSLTSESGDVPKKEGFLLAATEIGAFDAANRSGRAVTGG
jgi:hypothetical protein